MHDGQNSSQNSESAPANVLTQQQSNIVAEGTGVSEEFRIEQSCRAQAVETECPKMAASSCPQEATEADKSGNAQDATAENVDVQQGAILDPGARASSAHASETISPDLEKELMEEDPTVKEVVDQPPDPPDRRN